MLAIALAIGPAGIAQAASVTATPKTEYVPAISTTVNFWATVSDYDGGYIMGEVSADNTLATGWMGVAVNLYQSTGWACASMSMTYNATSAAYLGPRQIYPSAPCGSQNYYASSSADIWTGGYYENFNGNLTPNLYWS